MSIGGNPIQGVGVSYHFFHSTRRDGDVRPGKVLARTDTATA